MNSTYLCPSQCPHYCHKLWEQILIILETAKIFIYSLSSQRLHNIKFSKNPQIGKEATWKRRLNTAPSVMETYVETSWATFLEGEFHRVIARLSFPASLRCPYDQVLAPSTAHVWSGAGQLPYLVFPCDCFPLSPAPGSTSFRSSD